MNDVIFDQKCWQTKRHLADWFSFSFFPSNIERFLRWMNVIIVSLCLCTNDSLYCHEWKTAPIVQKIVFFPLDAPFWQKTKIRWHIFVSLLCIDATQFIRFCAKFDLGGFRIEYVLLLKVLSNAFWTMVILVLSHCFYALHVAFIIFVCSFAHIIFCSIACLYLPNHTILNTHTRTLSQRIYICVWTFLAQALCTLLFAANVPLCY